MTSGLGGCGSVLHVNLIWNFLFLFPASCVVDSKCFKDHVDSNCRAGDAPRAAGGWVGRFGGTRGEERTVNRWTVHLISSDFWELSSKAQRRRRSVFCLRRMWLIDLQQSHHMWLTAGASVRRRYLWHHTLTACQHANRGPLLPSVRMDHRNPPAYKRIDGSLSITQHVNFHWATIYIRTQSRHKSLLLSCSPHIYFSLYPQQLMKSDPAAV